MFQTSEVRWFHKQPMTGIAAWFADQNLSLNKAAARSDFYQIIQTDDLGIKLREGQVETKRRIRQLGLYRFSPDVSGYLEEWHKWSFRINTSDRESYNILNQEAKGWVGVNKERIGVKAVSTVNGWEHVPMNEFPPNGIQIEYTRITISGQVYYSFCLESFGESKPDITTYPMMDIAQGCLLTKEDSYSYPRLLMDLL